MSSVVYLKDRRVSGTRGGGGGGGEGEVGRVSSRNWRRHPPVTFYSLTLADYRQLMHNKYTPLRVHYHLINISLWRERAGVGEGGRGFYVTDVFLRLRASDSNQATSARTTFLFLLWSSHNQPPGAKMYTVAAANGQRAAIPGSAPTHPPCGPRGGIELVMDKPQWLTHLT